MTKAILICDAPTARALRAGIKSQLRLPVGPSNCYFGSAPDSFWKHADFKDAFVDGTLSQYLHVAAHGAARCRACGTMGWKGTRHRLWPRMAPASEWRQEPDPRSGYVPPASRLDVRIVAGTKAAVFMALEDDTPPSGEAPSDFSMTLKVVEVRAQRLGEITEEDALAEGVRGEGHSTALAAYRACWETAHGTGSWDAEQWIWAIAFENMIEEVVDARQ